jgi:hypothetical protein
MTRFLLLMIGLFALAVVPVIVQANVHCVCVNDPYGHGGVYDYGCIWAPCSICAQMCAADGGNMGTCTGCSTSPGANVYEKHTNVTVEGAMVSTSHAVNDQCTAEFFFPSGDCSGAGWEFTLGTCYGGSFEIITPFNTYKGSAMMAWSASSSTIGVAVFPGSSCSNAMYSSTLSNSCNMCAPLNVQVVIQGQNCDSHAYSSPATASSTGGHKKLRGLHIISRNQQPPVTSGTSDFEQP